MVSSSALHPYRILIVDDEASLRTVLSAVLRREGYTVATAQNATEALALLQSSISSPETDPFGAVICDIRMPHETGLSLLKRITEVYEDIPVIMLTAHGTVDMAVTALKMGAFDFMLKPFEKTDVLLVLQKAIAQRSANKHCTRPGPHTLMHHILVGQSSFIEQLHHMIQRIADTPSTVLITGESGTGKELVAKALHTLSKRAEKPLIRINCAAIPANLIEAELFGYEKGAFTGAVSSKPGRFELAHEGTLFLDEIGDLPIDMQAKLLRVLQESTFERVGGIKTTHVNVRLVAATNHNLQQAITKGQFREDLFYRLNVVPLHLAPLRERIEDIPLLVEHFLHKHNERLGRKIAGFTSAALEALQRYPWPGNIRELENIVERTILFTDHVWIEATDLPPEIHVVLPPQAFHWNVSSADVSLKDVVKKATSHIEQQLITQALEEMGGNVTHAAHKLKISRKSLQLKMKELGLRETDTYGDGKSPPSTTITNSPFSTKGGDNSAPNVPR